MLFLCRSEYLLILLFVFEDSVCFVEVGVLAEAIYYASSLAVVSVYYLIGDDLADVGLKVGQ